MNKKNSKTALSLPSRGSANGANNFQCIVYDDFGGLPLKVTYLNGRWWVTTAGSQLEPLEDYFGGEDIGFNYLCEAGGKVGALALTKMLGLALTHPETDVDAVLRNRVGDLKRLGAELDGTDEPLELELDVISNVGKPARQGEYSVICHLAGNICEQIFDIDAFESKQHAEEWAGYLFDYMDELNINYIIL